MRRSNSVAAPERSKILTSTNTTDDQPNSPSSSEEHLLSAEQCDWLSLSSLVAVSDFPNGTRASKTTKTVTNSMQLPSTEKHGTDAKGGKHSSDRYSR